jgi:hypothetical protein
MTIRELVNLLLDTPIGEIMGFYDVPTAIGGRNPYGVLRGVGLAIQEKPQRRKAMSKNQSDIVARPSRQMHALARALARVDLKYRDPQLMQLAQRRVAAAGRPAGRARPRRAGK